MTATRDFDDIARAWLDLMPDEVPDRVIADVLQAVEAMSQSRRRLAWPTLRQTQMKSSVVALGAAAVVVAMAGALVLSRSWAQPPAAATPAVAPSVLAPSTSASPATPAASGVASIPTALQHVWLGGHDDMLPAGTGAALVLSPGSLLVTASNEIRQRVLSASASVAGVDQLKVASTGPVAKCDAGQTGTYAWTLSPGGRTLTLRAISDPCTQRSAVLAATWHLVACPEPTDNCLGPIDAGTYSSQFVNFQHPAENWTPSLGAITYTVPDGWANTGDWPDHFELIPMASFTQIGSPNGPDHLIDITADVHAESAPTPCSGKPATAGSTPPEIIAALRTIPGLVVGIASAVTINGKTGLSVDLSVDAARVRPCGTDQVVEFLVGHTVRSGLLSGSADRLILIPMGSSTVSIEIVAPASDYVSFVGSALSIVTSLKLH